MSTDALLATLGIAPLDTNDLLGLWDGIGPLLAEAVMRHSAEFAIRAQEVRFGPPVPHPRKVIGVGLNYLAPGANLGRTTNKSEPVLFLKPDTALAGPDETVLLPPESQMVDWEVELAVVIGRGGRRIPVDDALRHVAGYTIANDLSARDVVRGPGLEFPMQIQVTRGKGYDGFCPLGPWLVTADEVADWSLLELTLSVNDEVRQHAIAGDMLVGVPELIASVSATMTLRPGDVILTGTPPGGGFESIPPTFLAPGDVVRASITGLGHLITRFRGEDRHPAAASTDRQGAHA